MISDPDTNHLYLADTLHRQKHGSFVAGLIKELNSIGIAYEFLAGTKDIWTVDYMPVQIAKVHFVQFVYRPDYLLRTKSGLSTISDSDRLCAQLSIQPAKCPLLLDGGNVVRWKDKVIITRKVFSENPKIPEAKVKRLLEEALQVDKIIFIPFDKNDFTGHADGMVRFVDSDTVLINNYQDEAELKEELVSCLRAEDLAYVEVPYNPYENISVLSAKGIYINYLQMEQGIVLPVYGMKEDEVAIRQFEQIFDGIPLRTIDSNTVAREGGVLNCITWNILR